MRLNFVHILQPNQHINRLNAEADTRIWLWIKADVKDRKIENTATFPTIFGGEYFS